MSQHKQILSDIKKEILSLIPDAKIYLFGSRSRGDFNEESDWDILILTKKKYPNSKKSEILDKLFPLSVSIGSFINLIFEQEDRWFNNAAYYALRLNVEQEKVAV